MNPLSMRTIGAVNRNWHDVLIKLGFDESFLTGKHGPCPMCGGKDRFRFDDKEGKGTYFCNQCGAGNGWKLLGLFHGWDFKTAAQEIDKVLGINHEEPITRPVRASTDNVDHDKELHNKQAKAAIQAALKVREAKPAFNHNYLSRKGIKSHGIGQIKNALIIPIMDVDGNIWSVQFIYENGDKRFLPDGKIKGNFYLFGLIDPKGIVVVCEGWATGATLHACTNFPIVVAFNSGNLKPVGRALRKKYPDVKIIFGADNDQYREDGVNIGVEKATEAARAVDGHVHVPQFKDISTQPTDLNDLYILECLNSLEVQNG